MGVGGGGGWENGNTISSKVDMITAFVFLGDEYKTWEHFIIT